jgi:hypothetical protein
MMNGPQKSDPSIRAQKSANNLGQPGAESMEQREGTKGNTRANRGQFSPCSILA